MSKRLKKRTIQKVSQLKEVLKEKHSLLIVLQDYPDPDGIAAAAALRELARFHGDMQTSIASSGLVGRSENRALVKYLGLNMLKLSEVDIHSYDLIAMLDTQPGTGNNALAAGITPAIVIDHHPIRSKTRSSSYYDIRSRYGSTSSILTEYLVTAGVDIPMPVATALIYGIRSDTDDLGREASNSDIKALMSLYPLANMRLLGRIQKEDLPTSYFKMLSSAVHNARICGKSIYTGIGETNNPDMISEIADLLLRNETSEWSLCFGVFERRMLISLRTCNFEANAGKIIKKIIADKGTGGGHHAIAGGQIPLNDGSESEVKRLERLIVHRFLKVTGCSDHKSERLVES